MAEPAAPAIPRRQSAGPASARAMMLTLLGECVLPAGGTAWTSAVVAAFERLGVAEKAARQALMRTANAGWLEPVKEGRRTRWELTADARRMLGDGAERIYSFGPADGWDGRWVLVAARIADGDRAARHRVRTRLAWAGFGSLGSGLWISPHAEREAEAVRVLREARVADGAHVFTARRSDVGDVRAMVGQAWDLEAIGAAYSEFNAEFRAAVPRDVLARQLELVHAWRRFPAIDPALPRELLPAAWNGARAAELFADRHSRWAPDARREWRRLNDPA